MRLARARLNRLLLLPLCGMLVQCSSKPSPPPPKPPQVVTIALSGGADQNPDVNGAASPVVVRVLQLTGTNKFERADVFALMDHQQQTLGGDEADSMEFSLMPSEHRSLTIAPKPGVTAIGLVALYRDIDAAHWRDVAAVAAERPTKLAADIGKLTVSLKPAP